MNKKPCDGKFDCSNKAGVMQESSFAVLRYFCDNCWDDIKNGTGDPWIYKHISRLYIPHIIL